MNAADGYLDHAATSWPKPEGVVEAVRHWYAEVGVSAARGDGPTTALAGRAARAARAGIAELCGVPADRVAFCSGATEGLNLALRALLPPQGRVLTTAFEHSSMARPLRALARERDCRIDVLPLDADGGVAMASLDRALASGPTALLAFSHGSNAVGALIDAVAWCERARQRGVPTLLDACQTAGHVPLDVGADVVVASCHKALHGPPGLGFVAVRPERTLSPQKQGGTGSSRALDEHPTEWPAAFEAGTPNAPAIAGLAAALQWRHDHPDAQRLVAARERRDRLAELLAADPDVRLLPPRGAALPILAFVHRRFDPVELGAIASGAGFTIRTGHLCAPWFHACHGTEGAGVVRVSPSFATPMASIDAFAALLRSL